MAVFFGQVHKYFLLTKAGNLNDCFVLSFVGECLPPSFVVALTRMDYIFHLAFCFFVNDWVDCQSAVARRFCFLGVIAGSCITSIGYKPALAIFDYAKTSLFRLSTSRNINV